jgi:hypothetical protein
VWGEGGGEAGHSSNTGQIGKTKGKSASPSENKAALKSAPVSSYPLNNPSMRTTGKLIAAMPPASLNLARRVA